ncbi:MAG TPA: hypothetical protein VEB19_18640, partial [Gemmatimonadaceae bacterium]|nr:hypothetical protein [Gemmatimonadaceae bacterium]
MMFSPVDHSRGPGQLLARERRRPLRSLGVLALLLWSLPVQADVSVSDAFPVAPHESVQATRPDVAMRPDGEFVVAWERHPEAGSGNVLARRFAEDGTALGKPFRVTSAPGHQGEPAVAMAEDGKFLVAWSGDGIQHAGIHARIFAPDGSALTKPFLVHAATPGGNEHAPSATAVGNGFAVAWVSSSGVSAIRLGENGTAHGGYSHAESDVTGVQVRGLPASGLALAWSSTHYLSLSLDSEGPVARVDGVVLSSTDEVVDEFRANEPRSGSSYDYIVDGEQRVSLASAADGAFTVAYDSGVPRYVYNVDDHDGPVHLGARLEMFDASADGF